MEEKNEQDLLDSIRPIEDYFDADIHAARPDNKPNWKGIGFYEIPASSRERYPKPNLDEMDTIIHLLFTNPILAEDEFKKHLDKTQKAQPLSRQRFLHTDEADKLKDEGGFDYDTDETYPHSHVLKAEENESKEDYMQRAYLTYPQQYMNKYLQSLKHHSKEEESDISKDEDDDEDPPDEPPDPYEEFFYKIRDLRARGLDIMSPGIGAQYYIQDMPRKYIVPSVHTHPRDIGEFNEDIHQHPKRTLSDVYPTKIRLSSLEADNKAMRRELGLYAMLQQTSRFMEEDDGMNHATDPLGNIHWEDMLISPMIIGGNKYDPLDILRTINDTHISGAGEIFEGEEVDGEMMQRSIDELESVNGKTFLFQDYHNRMVRNPKFDPQLDYPYVKYKDDRGDSAHLEERVMSHRKAYAKVYSDMPLDVNDWDTDHGVTQDQIKDEIRHKKKDYSKGARMAFRKYRILTNNRRTYKGYRKQLGKDRLKVNTYVNLLNDLRKKEDTDFEDWERINKLSSLLELNEP